MSADNRQHNRTTLTAAPAIPAWIVLSAGVMALTVGLGVSFRGAWLGSPEVIVATNGARWLMGLSVGALLGLAGASMPVLFRDRASPPILFSVSSGAALGCALGFTAFGIPGLTLGLLGAALFYGAVVLVNRGSWRYGHPLVCLMMFGMVLVAVYASSLTQVAYGLPRDLVWRLLGDVGHAEWPGAILITLFTGVLLTAAWNNIGRRWLGWLAVTAALITAGPIAFLSWFAFCTVQSRTGGEWRSGIVLAAFIGGTVLLMVDSVQRVFIGPFAYGLNVPVALLGVPLYLLWGKRSSAVDGQC